MRTFLFNDTKLNIELEIEMGQNAQENWDLIDKSEENDWWFHLQDYPSSHVVIHTQDYVKKKKDLDRKTIKYAALLCKQNSKMKSEKKVEVIYTQIKNVEKTEDVGSVMTIETCVIKI